MDQGFLKPMHDPFPSDKDVLVSPLMHCKAPAHSKISTPATRPRTKVAWTAVDDTRLVEMKKGGSSWTEIFAEFPKRTPGTIQVRCSTTLKSRLVKSDVNCSIPHQASGGISYGLIR